MRSNLFQEVVAIIHEHMAGDATVEQSAMLANRLTGEQREVDVVIRSTAAGYETLVKVEARASGRKADSTWVETQLGRHRNLPIGPLVLVSEAGFTRPARRLAIAEGAIPLAPEDVSAEDPVGSVVNAVPSLWPKMVALTPTSASAELLTPQGSRVRVRDLPGDILVFTGDGNAVASLFDAFGRTFDANFLAVAEMIGLADITEDRDEFFVMRFGPPEWRLAVDGRDRVLFLKSEEGKTELQKIVALEVRGRAVIQVGEVPLTHKRLGEVSFAYGEGELGGQETLIVASESAGVDAASLRMRRQPEGPDITVRLRRASPPGQRGEMPEEGLEPPTRGL